MVAFRLQKHLCLVHQAAESLGVDNAVDIPLVAGSYILKFVIFLTDAAFAFIRKSCKRIQPPMFLIFQFLLNGHKITPFTFHRECPVLLGRLHGFHGSGGHIG